MQQILKLLTRHNSIFLNLQIWIMLKIFISNTLPARFFRQILSKINTWALINASCIKYLSMYIFIYSDRRQQINHVILDDFWLRFYMVHGYEYTIIILNYWNSLFKICWQINYTLLFHYLDNNPITLPVLIPLQELLHEISGSKDP